MIRKKWNKIQHQLFINMVLTSMVIYSNVSQNKVEWMATIVVAAFSVMLVFPEDFITVGNWNSYQKFPQ